MFVSALVFLSFVFIYQGEYFLLHLTLFSVSLLLFACSCSYSFNVSPLPGLVITGSKSFAFSVYRCRGDGFLETHTIFLLV